MKKAEYPLPPLTPVGFVRADIVLSSGRLVRHTRMNNGAQQADIVGPTGPEMTHDEWTEYCGLLIGGR